MDIVSIFDDYDDFKYEIMHTSLRGHNVRERPNQLNTWNDQDFFKKFRLKKDSVIDLIHRIEHLLQHKTNRNHAVTPMQQLLLTLQFYASGNMYNTIGAFGSVHKSTAAKVVERVTGAICTLSQRYIRMPRNNEELQESQQLFYDIARFPRVLAALDCTLVKIQSPGGSSAQSYRCKKGYMAINVQAMCDASHKFINIDIKWPGSTHNNTIFNNSEVNAELENGGYNGGLILADSQYTLKPHLLTPLENPQLSHEIRYNESHDKTKNVIERALEMWKQRFPIVGLGLRCKIPLAQKIITATAVLHNIARNENEEPPFDKELEAQFAEQPTKIPVTSQNNDMRKQLLDYFSNLHTTE